MTPQEHADELLNCVEGRHVWLTPLPPAEGDYMPALVVQTCAICRALRRVTPLRAYGALVTR